MMSSQFIRFSYLDSNAFERITELYAQVQVLQGVFFESLPVYPVDCIKLKSALQDLQTELKKIPTLHVDKQATQLCGLLRSYYELLCQPDAHIHVSEARTNLCQLLTVFNKDMVTVLGRSGEQA